MRELPGGFCISGSGLTHKWPMFPRMGTQASRVRPRTHPSPQPGPGWGSDPALGARGEISPRKCRISARSVMLGRDKGERGGWGFLQKMGWGKIPGWEHRGLPGMGSGNPRGLPGMGSGVTQMGTGCSLPSVGFRDKG